MPAGPGAGAKGLVPCTSTVRAGACEAGNGAMVIVVFSQLMVGAGIRNSVSETAGAENICFLPEYEKRKMFTGRHEEPKPRKRIEYPTE